MPSSELIDDIQTLIDPEQNHGDGDGLAPIGAVVYCNAVSAATIDINTTISYDTGYSFDAVKSKIESAIDNYFSELAKAWESDKTGLVVRIARIESAILDVDGVIDVTDTKLNNSTANVILDAYSIPIRGTING